MKTAKIDLTALNNLAKENLPASLAEAAQKYMPNIVGGLAGTAVGGGLGYATTARDQDESDEEFAARRRANALSGLVAGGAFGAGAPALYDAIPRSDSDSGKPTVPELTAAEAKKTVDDFQGLASRASGAALKAVNFVGGGVMNNPYATGTALGTYVGGKAGAGLGGSRAGHSAALAGFGKKTPEGVAAIAKGRSRGRKAGVVLALLAGGLAKYFSGGSQPTQ